MRQALRRLDEWAARVAPPGACLVALLALLLHPCLPRALYVHAHEVVPAAGRGGEPVIAAAGVHRHWHVHRADVLLVLPARWAHWHGADHGHGPQERAHPEHEHDGDLVLLGDLELRPSPGPPSLPAASLAGLASAEMALPHGGALDVPGPRPEPDPGPLRPPRAVAALLLRGHALLL
jgi:hypothetical protein